jgi:ESF2/ABP1 family protein
MPDAALRGDRLSPRAASPSKKPSSNPLSKKKLAKLKEKGERSGVVYMSRIPPHMKPLKLRQMLELHAKLGRIYMSPKEAPPKASAVASVKASKQGNQFSEAWIEFIDKRSARAVAELLNGNPMAGKARSRYHDDLWTLKYLPKFKWDHLTEEVGMQPFTHVLWQHRHAAGHGDPAVDACHGVPTSGTCCGRLVSCNDSLSF